MKGALGMPRIIELEKYGEGRHGGWWWKLLYPDERVREYHTNSEGEGLFLVGAGDRQRVQCEGTCQFSLPRDRRATRRKLQRVFAAN